MYCNPRVGDTSVTFSEPRNITTDFGNCANHFVAWNQLPSEDQSQEMLHAMFARTHRKLCDEFPLMDVTVSPAYAYVEFDPCVVR